ncbi:MAG: hypothetical protein ACRCRZ_02665 [Metamycoplasmataceae bacterium]
MAITITNDSTTLKNNLIIILKNQNDEELLFEKEENVLFIFRKNYELIGMNIFNYKNFFKNIKSGFHKLSEEDLKFLIDKFPDKFKNYYSEDFLQISTIKETNIHPKNPRLLVMKIQNQIGEFQVLTNILDIKKDEKYLIGMNGTVLADGTTIVESKINNVISQGMLISYKALGVQKNGLFNVSNLNSNDDVIF